MANQSFNINSKEMVVLANKLEKTHRSALPIAVRGTLNDAAFDMKQNEIEKSFDDQFVVRKSTFIKSHTTVNKSPNTFDIDKMHSAAGVIKGKSSAGDLLEVQEKGGVIPKRDNIPTPQARASANPRKLVSKRNYLNRVKVKKNIKKHQNQKYIRAAFATGKGGYIIYDDMLYRLKTVKKLRNNKIFIKSVPLYSVDDNRSVHIQKSPFLSNAGKKTSRKIDKFYVKNAQKQFKKYLGK